MKKTFEYKIPENENKVELNPRILSVLEIKEMSFGDIAIKTKMEDRKSLLSYHLTNLVDKKLIGKKTGGIYYIIEIQGLDKEILKILESDNCGKKTINQIKEKLKSSKTNISEKKTLETLEKLEIANIISKNNGFYEISQKELGNHNHCTVCRKRFDEKNELIISQIVLDEDDDTRKNLRLHATCRSKLDNPSWSNQRPIFSQTDCDYCGLSLNASLIKIQNGNEINIDKEIDILFDNPFSKIFSVLSTKGIESIGGRLDLPVGGYAYYEQKESKQYHPYCLKIVEGKNQ